ncbi:cell adhesion protein [Haloferax marisrubri]|uniref:Cell adhesion protein n=1 Tax=Haloferax marisrubri TaxID=1544719 RepID=A0A2P4NR25_9EURY|nr:cell adhesion protein [Haloferax marisrubri]
MSDELKIDAGENVSVWQYSLLTLRPNNPAASSEFVTLDDVPYISHEIRNTNIFVGTSDLETSLDKNRIYVFNKTEITATFNPGKAGQSSVVDGEKVQLVAVRLKEGAKQPGGISDIGKLLTTSKDTNAEIVDEFTGQSGTQNFRFTPNESGQYIFATVLVENSTDPGLVQGSSPGNLTAEGNVTVVGFDHFLVQDGRSTVTPPEVAAVGNDVNVDVDASNLGTDDVSHTTILLNESVLGDQQQTIQLNGSEVEEIQSSIDRIEGATDVKPGTNFAGSTLPASRYNGNTNIVSLLSRLAGEDSVTQTDDTVIYTSINGTVGGPKETVTLRTTENFTPGNYSVVHFATAQNGTATLSNKATVELVDGVQLNIEPSAVEIQQGESVTLNVTRADTGDRVAGANVTYNGKTFTTDSNGQVTFTPVESGTATATKAPSDGTAYISSSVDLYVITPNIELTDYNVSSTSVTTDETVTVNATIENTDYFGGNFTVDLKRDGQTVESKTVFVGEGETVVEQFELSFDAPGTYDVTVNDATPTAIEVSGVPDIVYSNFTAPSQVSPGETTVVSADVSNNGTGAGEYNASLVIDGQTVEWMNGTLAPDESTTVTFEKDLGPGTYQIAIDGLPAQTVTVDKPANLEYSNLQVNATEIGLEDDVNASATVTNTGDVSDTFTATLSVDDEITQTKSVTLDGGESKTVSFTVTGLELGEHTVRIGDLSPETVTVKAPDITPTLSVETNVTKGVVPVNATVENRGNVEATGVDVIVEAKADNGGSWEELTSRSVDLAAGESVAINTTLARVDARNYSVRVVADPADEIAEASETNNEVDARVTGGPLAKGYVKLPDGSAAVDDLVYTSRTNPGDEPWFVGQTFTDENGRFLVPVVNGTTQTIAYVQDGASGWSGDHPRDGSPDIFSLYTTQGTERVLNVGNTTLPDAGLLNVTVVDQNGDPVENATIAVQHNNDGTRSGVAYKSNADGLFPAGEGDKTGIEVRGDMEVRVTPPENDRFVNRTYWQNLTVDTSGANLTFRLAEGADLSPELDVERRQRFNDGVNASVTVSNDGLVNVSNATVNLTVEAANGETETYTKYTGNLSDSTDAPNNETTLSYDLTEFASEELLGTLAQGNARVTATVDPANEIPETDETNNQAVNTTRVVYADPTVRIQGQSTVLQSQSATLVVFTKNNGTAPTGEFNVTVDYDDGTTENITIGNLGVQQPNTTRVTHNFATGGDKVVRASVSDGVPFDNNESTKDVTVKPYTLSIEDDDVSVPSTVVNNSTVTVLAEFNTNYPSNVNATVSLPSGLELVDGQTAEKQVRATGNGGSAAWKVRGNTTADIDDAQIDVTVEAFGESDTASATTNVTVPKVRYTTTNATTLESAGETQSLALNISDATTYEHTLNVTVQAGTDGRTLQGLEYLFSYPYWCVEQTTTQMMSALRTDQYYRDGDIPSNYDRDRANSTISAGISKLADEPTPGTYFNISQHDNGAWSMYGNNPRGDLFYTIYALQGASAVSDDAVQSNRTDVNASLKRINQSGAVLWLADKQRNDGSVRPNGYFLRDRTSATAYTTVAIDRAGDDLNATAQTAADEFSVDAAVHLIERQNSDGSWEAGSREAQATAYAVQALAAVNDSDTLRTQVNSELSSGSVSMALDSGTQWLVANQHDDGSWTGYTNSPYWSNTGEKARATGNAIIALNAAEGYTAANNDTVSDGVGYLVGIYQQGGSFGNTRATGVAIDALTTADQRNAGSQTVTVEINSTVSKNVTVDGNTPTAVVSFTTDELETLRQTGSITLTAENSTRVVVGAESEQLVNEQEYEDAN